ncbi:crossover junction endodeoxyribonuclease RuvC [Piscirickettsia litoralis]|uniref:Crossover junction endodeoxyribonuclease RuvC n=1 Tax=Piscirickettsia litoralis TaxID=1891921 RepID=A0ABX3A4N1_9GAMM|nr:crossover junction endodeoxyribonuclease RuvC [Piscirickettsia litoralis]ODN43813.1 crossover junction endodeoxyribonuclease RuvC [Piscirickettsia litoralis]
MAVILGIDPGSRVTGFGVIRFKKNRCEYLASGCIRMGTVSLAERLQKIFQGLKEVITLYQPEQVGIEKVFVGRNVDSALKLGHARGAAILAAVEFALPVSEYSARQVKRSVVGFGAADKNQVQQMISALLKLNKVPSQDAADALAIAICHAQMQQGLMHIQEGNKLVKGRIRP